MDWGKRRGTAVEGETVYRQAQSITGPLAPCVSNSKQSKRVRKKPGGVSGRCWKHGRTVRCMLVCMTGECI